MTLNGVMALISLNSVAPGAHSVNVYVSRVRAVTCRCKKFAFAILSPDEFLVLVYKTVGARCNCDESSVMIGHNAEVVC